MNSFLTCGKIVELGKLGLVELLCPASVLTGTISMVLWAHAEVRVCEISVCLHSVSCRDLLICDQTLALSDALENYYYQELNWTELVYTLESLYSTEMVFINDPRVFLPRGALQYQTLSDSLKLSKALGLCHSESRDGLSLEKYSSNALTGNDAGFFRVFVQSSTPWRGKWVFVLSVIFV